MPSDPIEPPSITLDDAARRVVAIYLNEAIDSEMPPNLTFAIGMLAGALEHTDRSREGGTSLGGWRPLPAAQDRHE